MTYGLPDSVIKSLKSIFQKYRQIEKVILYGSRAKGNYRPGSDIDLTLVAPLLSVSDLLKIETEIEDLNLPYKVDLSIREKIDNTDLLEHIARIGVNF